MVLMSLKNQCSHCNKPTKIITRGYCPTCYARYQRNGTAEYVKKAGNIGVTECSHCGKPDDHYVKSLCRACYQRQYKTGSLAHTRVRHLCRAVGCDEPVKGNGLCERHYMRLRRHGDESAGRPEGWGAKSKHPLHEAWKSLTRTANRTSGLDPRWKDFWLFIEDVGERPEPGYRLYRKNESLPYGKDNAEWREPVHDEPQRKDKNEYMRTWRAKRGDKSRNNYLQNTFGISLDEYKNKLAEQGGLCAIHKGPETVIDRRTGLLFPLAVDHDHETGAVRGLLCMGCNRGIGGLQDSVSVLESAITYLKSHQT